MKRNVFRFHSLWKRSISLKLFNLFVLNALFLYPLNTSENSKNGSITDKQVDEQVDGIDIAYRKCLSEKGPYFVGGNWFIHQSGCS